MLKAGFICCVAFLSSEAEAVHAADLPPVMNCKVSGYAGCDGDICSGAGIKDPSINLTISRSSHTLRLNGILGTIDDKNSDPYADGNHKVGWKWGVIAFETYRLDRHQPDRVYLTLHGNGSELEFHCLGRLYAKQ